MPLVPRLRGTHVRSALKGSSLAGQCTHLLMLSDAQNIKESSACASLVVWGRAAEARHCVRHCFVRAAGSNCEHADLATAAALRRRVETCEKCLQRSLLRSASQASASSLKSTAQGGVSNPCIRSYWAACSAACVAAGAANRQNEVGEHARMELAQDKQNVSAQEAQVWHFFASSPAPVPAPYAQKELGTARACIRHWDPFFAQKQRHAGMQTPRRPPGGFAAAGACSEALHNRAAETTRAAGAGLSVTGLGRAGAAPTWPPRRHKRQPAAQRCVWPPARCGIGQP